MPHIDIPDLLAEVEGWTGFTGQLTHAAGATPRMGDLQQHLHAALLASGLNLGPTRMAECCPLSYRQLAWATEWYLGDEQLQAANDVLIDYLHQLQLASHWGTGEFSSSDGQRSGVRGRAAAADAMAREFGFRRGALNLVNWVSDQYSQYGTKVVSVAEREAIHTLEAILHTPLPITEHTTDTHGATVMWTDGFVKARWHHLSVGDRLVRRARRGGARGELRCSGGGRRHVASRVARRRRRGAARSRGGCGVAGRSRVL